MVENLEIWYGNVAKMIDETMKILCSWICVGVKSKQKPVRHHRCNKILSVVQIRNKTIGYGGVGVGRWRCGVGVVWRGVVQKSI